MQRPAQTEAQGYAQAGAQQRPVQAQGQQRQTQGQGQQRQAQARSAASYDRERYHARNASGQAQYAGQGSAAAGSRSAGHHARQESELQYDYNTVQYRDRHGKTRRQKKSYSKKPFAVVGVVVAFLLIFFGVSSCLKGSDDAGKTESGTAMEEQSATVAEDSASTDPNAAYLPTPYIAKSNGIKLHSAVAANQLTEILIHNASYDYASSISTKLAEATNTEVMAAHGTGRVADQQPTGDEWMTGEFIRCYRSGNAGPRMSAIDCGGPVGATVYAPVSGTVVRVKKYQLYNEYPDYQVHIQPEGRSDLDVVLIHLENVVVEEGDTVEGGVTPLASIRDVYAYIGDSMQLKYYTADGDNGNHTHIQVNKANSKDYHGLD